MQLGPTTSGDNSREASRPSGPRAPSLPRGGAPFSVRHFTRVYAHADLGLFVIALAALIFLLTACLSAPRPAPSAPAPMPVKPMRAVVAMNAIEPPRSEGRVSCTWGVPWAVHSIDPNMNTGAPA